MSNIAAKTSANVFYKARSEAAKHNEQLSSREGAADIMSIDRGRLYRIESGIANPYPEEIHLMADLYDRITLRTLSAIRKLGETKELLLDITEDGVIDESEKADMEKVLCNLEELEQIAQNMKLWIKKNL